MRRLIAYLVPAMFAAGVASAATPRVIRSVNIGAPSLNVAAGEIVTLTVDFAKRGVGSIVIVDRDGYLVRTLAKAQPVSGGPISFGWDARDDSGEFVADEAYSFKVDWRGTDGTDSYFPAGSQVAMTTIDARSYDRRSATLSYTLPQPSRVHIQAGTAILDAKTKKPVGPVMKTIVNREPRAGGTIAEHWSGYDESGAIFIPDLENFVVAIAATPLPENSVITFGNRKRRFVETLSSRRGPSLFIARGHHQHHAGLRTEDDVSPVLKIEPLNAVWSSADRAWIVNGGGVVRLRLAAEGPTASAFRAHPATVELFVDGRRIGDPSVKKGNVVEVPIAGQRCGTCRVSVNWNSEWGPVAANTIQVRVPGHESAPGGTR
jgi:hypothetical protein